MQKLAGDSQLLADFANLILVEGCQRLNDAAAVDQLLDSGNAIVMGLDQIGSSGAAGFDRVRIDGSLAQDPVAVEKMAAAQHALLHGDKLLADDVALLLRIANAGQRIEKFDLRIL